MLYNYTRKLAQGNYAVARGAFEAGVTVATAYPGTPSTEITEFLAEYPQIKAEWSPNEKVALEVAIGAAMAGARAICSMKHVGLNVAADPLFTVAYTGINGGLVIAVADDPGQHSSQNEQDTRRYGVAAKIPIIEPCDSEEARIFVKRAFELSEQYDTPVILRLVTRLSHSRSFINEEERMEISLKPYVKDIQKNVMIPAFSRKRRAILEQRLTELQNAKSEFDTIINNGGKTCVVCAGVVASYVADALPDASVYKIGRVFPLDIASIREFTAKFEDVLVVEELDPVIESELRAAGISCRGKEIFGALGELSAGIIRERLGGEPLPRPNPVCMRPPTLCPGCPHRAVFKVLNKLNLTVLGDIGCYSLGALPPYSGMDTLVCMGAGIGMAAGMEKARGRDFAKKSVAVIGDSTFIHSGITALIETVYNNLNTTVIILDNSTTGMTGHQAHPATGKNIYGQPAYSLVIEDIARAVGASSVRTVSAFAPDELEIVISEETARDGVSAIIARGACALLKRGGAE